MKKFTSKILFAASLSLGIVASASATSVVTYTTTTGIYNGNNGGNNSSFTFTLSDGLFSGTSDTTNASTTASDSSSAYAATTVSLDSILIVARNSGTELTADQIVITNSSGKTVATSTSYSSKSAVRYDVFDSSYYYTRYATTYSFENATLTVGETYTVTFYMSGDVSSQSLMTSYNGSYYSSSTVAATLPNSTNYQPGGMVITTSITSIPEPSTFGLLAGLGALALVASRRRRSRR